MEQDIEAIIRMLDEKVESGTSRIHVEIDQQQETDTVKENYHHGRCDVGSPWAKGTVRNESC